MKKILFLLSFSLLNASVITGEIGTDFEIKNTFSKTVKDIKNTEMMHNFNGKLKFFDMATLRANTGYYFNGNRKNIELNKKNTELELGINLETFGKLSFSYLVDGKGLILRNNNEQDRYDDNLEDSSDKNISLINFDYLNSFKISSFDIITNTSYAYILREEDSIYSSHFLNIGLGIATKRKDYNFKIMTNTGIILPKEQKYNQDENNFATRNKTFIINPSLNLKTEFNINKNLLYDLTLNAETRLDFEKNYSSNQEDITKRALRDVNYKIDLDNLLLLKLSNKTKLLTKLDFSISGINEKIYGIYLRPGLGVEYNIFSNLKAYIKTDMNTIFLNDINKEDEGISFSRVLPRLNTGIKFNF